MSKCDQIKACLRNIDRIMETVCPDKQLRIEYWRIDNDDGFGVSIDNFTEWEQKYFHILTGEEYIIIWDEEESHLLYVINITGDSILTALSELMNLMSRKF